VVIDNLELSDVVVFLHDPQEFEQDLRDWSQKDLFFTFALGVDEGFKGISEDVDFDHLWRKIL
jgi:hypothetical protein